MFLIASHFDERTVNYLHYGDSLASAHVLNSFSSNGVYEKRYLIDIATQLGQKNLVEVIRGFGPKRSRKVSLEELKGDLLHSERARSEFQALRCRGFSYSLQDFVEFCDPIRNDLNMRIALMADDGLFYPSKVKRYLRRVNNNHYFSHGFPSIAFSLGMRCSDVWYVFVLQSDLAFKSPSYVRDHFRGWRKILFAHILKLAYQCGCRVLLCRSEDALRCCSSSLPVPRTVPPSWKVLYDRTAEEFGMTRVRVGKAIDIHIFRHQDPVFADEFYEAKLTPSATENKQFEIEMAK
jgi:hypothetical protein